MRRILLACLLTLPAAGLMLAAGDAPPLVVHQWGTFSALNGSAGVSVPSFVHVTSNDQLPLPMSRLSSETAFTYFYPPRGVQIHAQVEITSPTGTWTHWYPQAAAGIGRLAWDVYLRPREWGKNNVPSVDPKSRWRHARDVDSSFVIDATSDAPDWERFIFYRGLRDVPMPIEVRLAGGRITASTSEREGLYHFFVVRVENGRGSYDYTTVLKPDGDLAQPVPSMDRALPLDQFVERISKDLAYGLTGSGLYKTEAHAMVNTWKGRYLKTDGVRVLFVLPQSWTNRFIPMRIEPKPEQLVRVMVGHVELPQTVMR